jgi:hypothetical protein
MPEATRGRGTGYGAITEAGTDRAMDTPHRRFPMQRSLRAFLLLPTGALPTTTLEIPVGDVDPDGTVDGADTLAVDVTALLGDARACGAPFVSLRFSALEDRCLFGDGSGI